MWEPTTHTMRYGGAMISGAPSHVADDQLARTTGPAPADVAHPLAPGSPLLVFMVIAGAAVGLMYASTTVRVGPVRASVSAGKP